MKSTKFFICSLLVLLLAILACSTSSNGEVASENGNDEQIKQEAIDQEEPPSADSEETLAKEPTFTSEPEPTSTSEPEPSSTPKPTEQPKDTYIVTTGSCLGYETRYIPTDDPVGFEYCDIDEKRQVPLSSDDTFTYSSFMPYKYPSFCAVHTLDGEYIMSDVDVDGLGEAVCTLPTPGQTSTQTPPEDTYIVSTGSCLGYETRYIPTDDPVGFEYCDIDERKQMTLVSGDTTTYSSFMPFKYPSFCAVHTLDGEYIMSDVDVDGLGEAVCTLP
jgi:hypothetical protein